MQSKIDLLTQLFEKNRNEANAGPMKKYMKDHFPFLGIKKPDRSVLEKQFFQETGLLKEPFNQAFIRELWAKDEREYQYTGLVYMEKSLKKLEKSDLPFMEELIQTKSWWDTVDAIAPKPVGEIAKRFPEVVAETIDSWATHDYLWLRRAALLFQLKYKENTNEELLYQYIRLNADSKEFFIQKAIGWALREYSKSNPASVKKFIEATKLAPLSVREGSKYLG
ncbi:DNA alkylation repair protein [Neobacillus sp. MER 74]|uniref:DNA alkylation repair protein n=1 Tax=Bacillaceae TaxID=186817 RepID=UPI000BF3B59D|nr:MULTISPECIES: DNA alkylation repair protein [Bacillaceae]MCM3116239.1 DNA alkylation repair protein [Neobacillus sp. MER 74]PFP31022.1 DNA alkylation repair protein [Bacillus sp. AFS073361]